MKKIVVFMLILTAAGAITAQEQPAETQVEENDTGISSSLNLLISTLPEAKLIFTESFRVPFLRGENPLVADNNVTFNLSAELTPISINGIADAIWTPIAFAELSAGGRLSSGWKINLFGGDIYGIGFSRAGTGGILEYDGSAFDGLMWKAQAGAALQFDLAAVLPGEWNHIVARTYHEINGKGYTRAKGNESWYFENDDGENCNGLNYYAAYLLGYQMPIFLNTVALQAEADLFLYDTPDRAQWGDEKTRWTFSGVLQFTLTEQLGLAVITQLRTRKNYLEQNWKDLYYRELHINSSDPIRLEFYRVAAALTYKF